ncbi:hypothetical protein OHT20_31565 [Streptomyces caniferus]|uniref:hypothetical protein n=1 Tax=Streptomyces caniferus TaxID=285557 RepID=UPI002E2D969B|nr:hypothetical protein [Streptomyces caniferus]
MFILRKLRAAGLLAAVLTGAFLSTAGLTHAETTSGAAAANSRLVIACIASATGEPA